jgi:hypothetical protein
MNEHFQDVKTKSFVMENKNFLDSLGRLGQSRKCSQHITYTQRTLLNVIGIDSIKQFVVTVENLFGPEPNQVINKLLSLGIVSD